MGKSYIINGTYAACTYQTSPSPQKFIDSRKVSVGRGKDPLLTVKDKNLEAPFVCKAPANMAASFLAFGGGLLAVGLFVLSGPVGWLVIGAGAIAVGAGLFFTVKTIKHTCTGPLSGGNWIAFHPRVKFDQSYAITHASILQCSTGGILKPFLSKSAASQAAKNIMWNNIGEITINSIISAFTGFFLPGSLIALKTAGLVKGAAILVGGNLVGLGVTWTMLAGEKAILRSDDRLEDNPTYEQMNEIEGNSILPDSLFGWLDEPSDFNDLMALENFIIAVSQGKVIIKNKQLLSQLKKLENIPRQQLRRHPVAINLHNALQQGKHPELKSAMSNFNKNYMRPNMRTDAVNHAQQLKDANKAKIKSSIGQGLLFFLPVISTFFSENARKSLALAIANDAGGINVNASRPLGN